nr:MAG TPA: hypothetical protein [Caudoviricetes sp.]
MTHPASHITPAVRRWCSGRLFIFTIRLYLSLCPTFCYNKDRRWQRC